jgi:hypothetical protein
LLAAAVQAAGGPALGKVHNVELTARRTVFLQGHKQGQSDVDLRVIYPSKMRLEVKTIETQVIGGYGSSGNPAGGRTGTGMPMGGGPVSPMTTSEHTGYSYLEGCDGLLWWRKSPGNIESHLCDERTRLRIDLMGALGIYRAAADGQLEGKLLGEQKIQGRHVQVLALRDARAKLYFDPQTYQWLGASYPGMSAGDTFDAFHWWTDYIMKVSAVDAGREQSIWWSEFRRVKFKSAENEESLQFPYLWTTYIDGIKFLEEKVTSVKLNTKLNPKIFDKPK